MKKGIRIWIIGLIIIISGCASFFTGIIESGSYFSAIIGNYDQSVPLEEHSFLINLADSNSSITGINTNGRNIGKLSNNEVIILRPGIYNIHVSYKKSNEASAAARVYIAGQSSATYSTSSANGIIENVTFEAGSYYFLRGGLKLLNRVEYEIIDLNSNIELENAAISRLAGNNYDTSINKAYDERLASGSIDVDGKMFKATSVIKGINAAIKSIIK